MDDICVNAKYIYFINQLAVIFGYGFSLYDFTEFKNN